MSNPTTPPAGWYPDPAGGPQPRWWDGQQWAADAGTAPQVAAQPFASQPAGYQPGYAPVAPPPALRAPAGTKPYTVWIWILVALPLLGYVGYPLVLGALDDYLVELETITDPDDLIDSLVGFLFSPGMLITVLIGVLSNVGTIVLALLDWRALKARGVPKPFHWAFAFFVFIVGNLVYVIGRSIVVRNRTGSGLIPLFIAIGLWVLSYFVSFVFSAVTSATGY
jgi:hypothetical protein